MEKIKSDRRGSAAAPGATDRDVKRRLARIEGQVRGIARMVEEGRYCVDVLTQVAAVHQALRQVSRRLLTEHMEDCLRDAFECGDEERRHELSEEIAGLMFKYSR